MSPSEIPADGLIAVVKKDCPTCVLVDPVLQALAASGGLLTVFVQDDPTFTAVPDARDDTSLAISWHLGIETVPTLLRRTAGWCCKRLIRQTPTTRRAPREFPSA